MDQHDCPFCRLDAARIRADSALALALLDKFPVAQGHTLVLPKLHVASLFDLPEQEQAAVWQLVTRVRALLLAEFAPDGFTVGLNDGPAAGQTVMQPTSTPRGSGTRCARGSR